MSQHIESKKGLETLLERYILVGVKDTDTYNGYKPQWLTVIKQCIAEGLAMDEVDYENTPEHLKPLWRGLK